MKKFLQSVTPSINTFVREEEGAQIIEYALIIAVVSLGLIVGFTQLIDTDFDTWIGRVGSYLTTGAAPAGG
jgi:pilus assembly protein Flp/PilA